MITPDQPDPDPDPLDVIARGAPTTAAGIDLLRQLVNELREQNRLEREAQAVAKRQRQQAQITRIMRPARVLTAVTVRPALAVPATSGPAEDNLPLGARDIADRFHLPYPMIRKRLDRWRAKSFGGYVEVDCKDGGGPEYLYKLGAVRHVINRAIAAAARGRKTGTERASVEISGANTPEKAGESARPRRA